MTNRVSPFTKVNDGHIDLLHQRSLSCQLMYHPVPHLLSL